eukprot:11659014-Alexandrium_andersonii.AAC.1
MAEPPEARAENAAVSDKARVDASRHSGPSRQRRSTGARRQRHDPTGESPAQPPWEARPRVGEALRGH